MTKTKKKRKTPSLAMTLLEKYLALTVSYLCLSWLLWFLPMRSMIRPAIHQDHYHRVAAAAAAAVSLRAVVEGRTAGTVHAIPRVPVALGTMCFQS